MPAEKRKPCSTPLAYPKKPKVGDSTPRTSARTTHKSRQNLTLADWFTVFAYIDSHPSVPQKAVVKHFATLKTGALLFTQPTLSRKLNDRADLQARVNANPSALCLKRRVVTRPDVEKARQPAFEAVMDAENDTDVAIATIEKLAHVATNRTGLKIHIPARPVIPQLDAVENDVAQLISELRARNRILGTPPTLDEFIEPPEEAETQDLVAADVFDGPGGDKAIVAQVVQEMAEGN